MHVVTDENGNVISHGHHHHDHDHHDHDHEHDHHHHEHHGEDGHCEAQSCSGCGGGCHTPEQETIALMTYMVDHNKHHAMELAEMSAKIRAMGNTTAADQIDRAVSEFESGNLRLGVALSLLKSE